MSFQPDPTTAAVFTVIAALLVLEIVIIARRLRRVRREKAELYSRYKDIVDKDAEIAKRELSLAELSQRHLVQEANQRTSLQSLSEQYSNAKTIYDSLRFQLAQVEETLELQSFGLYKPHFDFRTSEEYKARLEKNYTRQKDLIASGRAAVCSTSWSVGGSAKEGERMTKQAIKLMLRAFNGECDGLISKVKWNNASAMEERIRRAFDTINKTGTVNQIRLMPEYLAAKLEELHLTHELERKVFEEKEEQRRIAEEMREEERVLREIERAKKDAEDEEKRFQKALEKARVELAKAQGDEIGEMNAKVAALQAQLAEAQAQKARAISRAQMTKTGHVYVISNIGSFGDDVFKIGMTRRLEPLERIKELGDASVPFPFDVHALFYTENAPALEAQIHDRFDAKRVNLVNERKEFFRVSLDEIREFAEMNHHPITITKLAEAREFRETQAIRTEQTAKSTATPGPDAFPDILVAASNPPLAIPGGPETGSGGPETGSRVNN